MYVSNVKILKSEVFKCNEKLAKYILSRNIPVLSKRGSYWFFAYTDILKEILEYKPNDLRKEVYSIE